MFFMVGQTPKPPKGGFSFVVLVKVFFIECQTPKSPKGDFCFAGKIRNGFHDNLKSDVPWNYIYEMAAI
jgi:hypothetical protein